MSRKRSTSAQQHGTTDDAPHAADQELLLLADELEGCATSARTIAHRGTADERERERERLRAMLRAWEGVRAEIGAPYRDARMVLVQIILTQAAFLGRDPRMPANPPKYVGEAAAAEHVASLFPALAARMSEPARLKSIRAAIVANARRRSWKSIAATWEGIEAETRGEETWRQDWARWCRARGWEPGNWPRKPPMPAASTMQKRQAEQTQLRTAPGLVVHKLRMPDAKLTPHDRRRVGVVAGVDPRTVEAFLRGEPTRSTTAARIFEALRSLGFEVTPETRNPSPGSVPG